MNTVNRVKELADERNLTLYALAKKCGISHSTLINTQARGGQLTIDTLERICQGLGITMAEFFAEKSYGQ